MEFEREKNDRRWLMLRAKLAEERIKEAFGYLRERGVEPILIKGWAAARLYPESYLRVSADIDLVVAPESYEKTKALLKETGIKHLNIDLHSGLRHLDTVGWENLFENSRIVEAGGIGIRILRSEDHLRVLCVHWLNDGGAYKERLLDIYYAVKHRPADFDWERCLGVVPENRRQWIVKTIGLAGRYYDLEIDRLPFGKEARELPVWLISSLEREWASGIRLIPLHTLSGRRTEFWRQLRKRIPPNAVQATIEMEGKFDDRPRFPLQARSFVLRLISSARGLPRTLKIIFDAHEPKPR